MEVTIFIPGVHENIPPPGMLINSREACSSPAALMFPPLHSGEPGLTALYL